MKRSLIIVLCAATLAACSGRQDADPGQIYYLRDKEIWRLDLSDGQESLFLDRTPSGGMSVSPDGLWLVYSTISYVSPPDVLVCIWAVDVQTGLEREIVHEMGFAEALWMPDGRLLVIEYPDWQVSADGARVTRGAAHHRVVDPATGESSPPAWTVPPPDDGGILYAPTFDCAAEILLNDLGRDSLRVLCEGGAEPVVVATPLSLGAVAWSADGRLLAFYAGEGTAAGDSWRLTIWDRAAGLGEGIAPGTRRVIDLSWSPDGRWLAYGSLCLLQLADGSVTCFDDYVSAEGRPVSWSPDGERIVLSTSASGVCGQVDCSIPALVTVGVPGGEVTVLATGVDVGFPVWGK